ncbi:MAG TPA: DNA repair exonuclease, partial [Cupriavidus sp.]|nr:DNA repair exonuclease [Cupriavidus sp.]
RRVEELLKEQAASIRREAEEISVRRKTLLDQYQLPSELALDERIAAHRETLTELERREALARASSDAAQASLRKGELESTQIKAWKEAEGAYALLSARVPAVDTDRARLQAARRAAQVTPVAQLLEVARQDQTAALAANAAAGTRVASASRAADIATGALRAEQARGEARLAAQRTVAKLEAILPQARRLGV